MTTERKDGGPAFPITDADRWGKTVVRGGMSLRDWFAGQALAGMLAWKAGESTVESFAETAYMHADAMLSERQKGGA
jgi:hypothetical protein